jgi:phospholipase C
VRHRRRAPVALAGCTPRRTSAPDGRLDAIEHVIVIYAENRSFDNLYGLFPGADGLHDAGRTIQVDRDGTPLRVLPPVWQGNAPDPLFPAHLPNAPFRIDAAPIDLPLSRRRDLVHRYRARTDRRPQARSLRRGLRRRGLVRLPTARRCRWR